jgi:hypothetical protein
VGFPNLSVRRSVGTGTLPTPVTNEVSYVDAELGGFTFGLRGMQQPAAQLPPSRQLQPTHSDTDPRKMLLEWRTDQKIIQRSHPKER